MTVKELKEKLNEYDDNIPVMVVYYESEFTDQVELKVELMIAQEREKYIGPYDIADDIGETRKSFPVLTIGEK